MADSSSVNSVRHRLESVEDIPTGRSKWRFQFQGIQQPQGIRLTEFMKKSRYLKVASSPG